ncbi:MAG: hypothetical protein Q7T55_19655, partial [Solirubrobacteraceae bacterium]|nr:hypothetical protein [Solirubrobacteraceae bacterium]
MSHSSLSWQHASAARNTPRAARHVAAFLLMFLAVFGVGTTAASAAETTAAQRSANLEQLCQIWDASADNPKVTIAEGITISGSKLARTGASCDAPGASIRILDAKVAEAAPGTPVGTAAARVLAAVTHAAETGELTEGSELFSGASISRIEVGFDTTIGLFLQGELRLAWSGGTNSYLVFRGGISGLDSFDFQLSSPAAGTQFPNIGGSPLNFAGSLKLRAGRYTLDLKGKADKIVVGEGDKQITITNGSLDAHLTDAPDGSQKLALTVAGQITYGTNIAIDGSVDIDFDDAGVSSVHGGGKVVVKIPASGSSPAGQLTGDANLKFDRGAEPLIDFTGEARFGEAVILGAKGTVDLSAINFTGDATVKNKDITFVGAVEGVVYIGLDLTGRTITDRAGKQVQAQNSDWLIKSATATVTAKGFEAKGVAQVGDVADQRWLKANGAVDAKFTAPVIAETTAKGTASVDWLEGTDPKVDFAGSIESGSTLVANAKGSIDGKKLDFAGDVTLSNPDLKITGSVDGSFYYGENQTGSTVTNRAGAQVQASKGDFFLKTLQASVDTRGFLISGTATLGRVGEERWAKVGGKVQGSLGGAYNGTTISGSADLDWASPAVPTVKFKGFVHQGTEDYGNAIVWWAEGSLDGKKLSIKGKAAVYANGFSVEGDAEGVVYYGADRTGETTVNREGKDVTPNRGDFLFKAKGAAVTSNGVTFTGDATLARTGGVLWAKATGGVDAAFGTTKIKGSVSAGWSLGRPVTATFAGSVSNGSTIVAGATGEFDGQKLIVKGTGSYTDPKFKLDGAVEGVVYVGDDLAGETVANRAGVQVPAKKGDFLVKGDATGQVAVQDLNLTGAITVSSVGGDLWASAGGTVDLTVGATKIKGSATASWAAGQSSVAFEGNVSSGDVEIGKVKGTIDAGKITFAGEAKVTNPLLTATGTITEGVVYYGNDLTGQKVTNRAGEQVQAVKGDLFLKLGATAQLNTQSFKITGAANVGRTSGELWARGSGAADLSAGTTSVKGSATIEWVAGTSPFVTFEGSVSQDDLKVAGVKGTLDDKKITFTGEAALELQGYATKGSASGVVYYGSDLSGETVKNRAGEKVPATKGDVVITSAKASVSAKGLTLAGDASISYVGGKLFADGTGSVDFTSGETTIKGSATATWAMGEQPIVAFKGSVTQGSIAVGNVVGTLDGKKLSVKGDAKVTDPKFTISGSAEGVVYYGDDLAGETVKNKAGASVAAKKGDFVLSDASAKISAKGLDLTGKLTLGSVGGEKWATVGGTVDLTYGQANIKGSATLEWTPGVDPVVTFAGALKLGDVEVGSVSGTADGKKISFNGKAAYKNATVAIDGNVSGVVYYGSDLAGEKIKNKAGTEVTPNRGDFAITGDAAAKVTAYGVTLGGKVAINGVGTDRWVSAQGTLDVVYGQFTVKGSATIDWTIGSPFPAIPFTGSVKSADVDIASVKGTITDKSIEFAGTAGISNTQLAVTGAVEGKLFWAADQTGQTVKNYAGAEVQPKQYDLFVKSASAKVDAKGFTLTGAVEIGVVSGEKWVKGGGTVDATFGATTIKGAASVDYLFGGVAKLTFSGSLSNGTTFVGNASGSIDGKKISVKGDAKVTDPKFTVTGSVEGAFYYGDDLTGETVKNKAGDTVAAKKGDFVLADASTKITAAGLELTGKLTLSSVGGDLWATAGGTVDLTYGQANIKGSATLAWAPGTDPVVTFTGALKLGDTEVGSVAGTADGKKISFTGKATYKNATVGVDGNVSGVVYYGENLTGEKIKNKAGADVTPSRGDFAITGGAAAKVTAYGVTLGGKVGISGVGADKWISAEGDLEAVYGAYTVKGSASINWTIGSAFPAIPFTGSVKSGDVDIASVKGTITDKFIEFAGTAGLTNAQLALSGAVEGKLFWAA